MHGRIWGSIGCIQLPRALLRSPTGSSQRLDDLQPTSRASSFSGRCRSPDSQFASQDLADRLRQQLQATGGDAALPLPAPQQGRGSLAFPKPPAAAADASAPMLTVQPQPAALQDRNSPWTQLQLAMNHDDMRREGDLPGTGAVPTATPAQITNGDVSASRTASLQAALDNLRRGSAEGSVEGSVDGEPAKATGLKYFKRGSSESIGSEARCDNLALAFS